MSLGRTPSPMLSTLAAYGLIACFLAMERLARRGQEAKSLAVGPFDRGSTRLLGVAFLVAIVAILVAPVLNAFQIGAMGWAGIGWVGVGLMISGIALRFWANQVLGRFYTRTMRIAEDQQVITRWPYKVVRHPGYCGTLVMWVGAGFAVLNWVVATAVIVVMCGTYTYRIRCEEGMLKSSLGQEYETYMAGTWRLVPFVY